MRGRGQAEDKKCRGRVYYRMDGWGKGGLSLSSRGGGDGCGPEAYLYGRAFANF